MTWGNAWGNALLCWCLRITGSTQRIPGLDPLGGLNSQALSRSRK